MKAAKSWRAAAAALAIGFVSSSGVAAEGAGMLQSCWTPESLAGRPVEKLSQVSHDQTPNPAAKLPTATPSPVTGSIRRVKLPPGRKLVALTFDLCESGMEIAGYDGAVIDYLRAQKVKATLFAGGRWMVHHGERSAQLMADPLFEIGTHGWSHANLHVVTGPAVDEEIAGGLAAFAETSEALNARACVRQAADVSRIPAAPKLFRFPFGTCTPEALAVVASEGQLAIQWDVVTGDPDRHITPEAIAHAVLAETKPGSIIVAHANGRGLRTAEALPLFVPQLRARGYEFVTVGELLAAGTPEIAPTCYERRPGDNARYDIVAKLRKEHQPAPVFPTTVRKPAAAPVPLPWTSHIEGSP
jgi:peptidoglycan-N-acetylglucosamine deacetylase